jgi:arylsulfatase A
MIQRFILIALMLWVGPWLSIAKEKPHVVILLVDDMGYGDLGCYNPESKIPTPHMDRLAREGLRFTDAHAPGTLCHPSRYGLLTGRYPFRTDVSIWPTRPIIEADRMTLASLLKSQDYQTAMVGKWHLGFYEKGYDQPLRGGPVDLGFDTFFGMRASTDIPPYFYIRGDRAVMPPTNTIAANRSEGWSPIQGAFWREGGIAPDLELKDVLPRFTDEAVTIIRNHPAGAGDPPLMLYLAYPAPHTPWLPSPEFDGRSKVGMYGDFVMMLDAMIGRVLAALDERGMSRNTFLVLTSDNGPVWYEADRERFRHDSAGGWRGMKGDAWEGGHRMPFIIRWPERVKAGTVTAQTICFTDLLATLADLLGVKLPSAAAEDSFSLLPVLLSEQPEHQPIRGPVVIASANGFITIRSGPWKLIEGLGSGGFSAPSRIQPGPDDPPGQLYHLADDPQERTNLWRHHPEMVSQLREALAQIRDSGRSRP